MSNIGITQYSGITMFQRTFIIQLPKGEDIFIPMLVTVFFRASEVSPCYRVFFKFSL